MVNQLTLRGFDDELRDHLRSLAAREGISLNKAALRLLRKGAGLTAGAGGNGKIGSSLDHLFGTWTDEEADAFDALLQQFETIDEPDRKGTGPTDNAGERGAIGSSLDFFIGSATAAEAAELAAALEELHTIDESMWE